MNESIILKKLKDNKIVFCTCLFFLFTVICVCTFYAYVLQYKNINNISQLDQNQYDELETILNKRYQQERSIHAKPLPYPVVQANLDVTSGAAIIIDASNGCILYEKNSDEVISPASITKIFVMYIVFEELEKGNISLDDIVPLPRQCWAVSLPFDASKMFLNQGQTVTVRELLQGLAVASGNDAAIALALYISGSVDSFVERMNSEVSALGFKNTHFVEPSGYDEHNLTTAKELASFARIYINRFPQSIKDYHSLSKIEYPKKHNLPLYLQDKGDSTAVIQYNTNPLLGKMEGCDGLKTGFIYESRYNLALTAMRRGVRYISVTMKGLGQGSRQGNAYRIHDGTEMMEWAFAGFADYDPKNTIAQEIIIATPGSKQKGVKLVPAWTNTITVPAVNYTDPQEAVKNVKAAIKVPPYIYKQAKKSQSYGQIVYSLDGSILETVPLVCDRDAEEGSLWTRMWGKLVCLTLKSGD